MSTIDPVTPGDRTKSYAGLVAALICGAALLVTSVVAIGVFAVAAGNTQPSRQVAAYLGALIKGEASAALKIDGTKVTSADLLLTDEVYSKAQDRISAFAIIGTTISGKGAAVVVRYTQGGQQIRQTFQLRSVRKDLFVFDHWRLAPVPLGTARVTVDGPDDVAVTIAGEPVRLKNGAGALRALPGQYVVGSKDTAAFTTWDSDATVTGLGAHAVVSAGAVELTLTARGRAEATKAVNGWIDHCVASTALVPSGCSFGLSSAGLAGVALSNQKWTLVTRPTFTIGAWDGHGWDVNLLEAGAVTFRADARDAAGDSGTITSVSAIPVKVGGLITELDTGHAVFTSNHWLPSDRYGSSGGSTA